MLNQLYEKFPELIGLQGLSTLTLKMQSGPRDRYYQFVSFINGEL